MNNYTLIVRIYKWKILFSLIIRLNHDPIREMSVANDSYILNQLQAWIHQMRTVMERKN